MTMPTDVLEIGFDANPLDALSSVAWTKIHDSSDAANRRLRRLQTSRGRKSERDSFSAGTGTFILSNADRLLDPTYTAGTYYGKIRPMNRVRHRTHRGAAISLNGTTQYGTSAATTVSPGASSATYEGWLYPTSIGAQHQALAQQDGAGTGRALLYIESDNTFRCNIGNSLTGSTGSILAVANNWYHLAAVWDRTASTVTVYLNGNLYAQTTGVTGEAATGVMVLGAAKTVAAAFWAGRIDDVRVWNTARSASQIRANMNKELVGTETGLVAYWKLDEAAGTTAASSATANTITFTGAPSWATGSNSRPYYTFTGYAEAWTPRYHGPNDATVELRAVDAFKMLNLLAPTRTPYSDAVMDDSPYLYWRLGETVGVTANDETSNNRDGTYTGGPTLGLDAMLTNDDSRSIQLGPNVYVEGGNIASFERTDSFSLECWFNAGDTQQPSKNLIGRFDEAAGRGYAATLDGYGFIDVFLSNAVGNRITVVAGTPVTDALDHHLVVTYDGSSTAAGVKIYKDGVQISTSTVTDTLSATMVTASATFRVGTTIAARTQDVAVYTSVLSAARVLAHYNAGRAPWDGQRSSERVSAILDLIDWPAADRRILTGGATLAPQKQLGSVLEAIRGAVDAELGVFFVASDGVLEFQDRYVGISGSESTTIYGDSGSEIGYTSLEPDFNDDTLFTQVTATAQDGVPQVLETTAQVTKFGRRNLDVEAPWRDDNQARGVAEKILDRYDTEAIRFPSIRVVPVDDTYWTYMLSPRLHSERITVKRRPPGGGSVLTQECWIEGIDHSATPDFWETTFQLAPADTAVAAGGYLTLNSTALNSGAVLAY